MSRSASVIATQNVVNIKVARRCRRIAFFSLLAFLGQLCLLLILVTSADDAWPRPPIIIVGGFSVPYSLLIALFISTSASALVCGYGLLGWLGFVLFHREFEPDRCACGYSLTGNTSGTCPECGSPVPASSYTTDAEPQK